MCIYVGELSKFSLTVLSAQYPCDPACCSWLCSFRCRLKVALVTNALGINAGAVSFFGSSHNISAPVPAVAKGVPQIHREVSKLQTVVLRVGFVVSVRVGPHCNAWVIPSTPLLISMTHAFVNKTTWSPHARNSLRTSSENQMYACAAQVRSRKMGCEFIVVRTRVNLRGPAHQRTSGVLWRQGLKREVLPPELTDRRHSVLKNRRTCRKHSRDLSLLYISCRRRLLSA
jgi:hypothetical protein